MHACDRVSFTWRWYCFSMCQFTLQRVLHTRDHTCISDGCAMSVAISAILVARLMSEYLAHNGCLRLVRSDTLRILLNEKTGEEVAIDDDLDVVSLHMTENGWGYLSWPRGVARWANYFFALPRKDCRWQWFSCGGQRRCREALDPFAIISKGH